MNLNTQFTREDTKALKGLTIIFMLMHHLWGFNDRIPYAYPIRSPQFSFLINGKFDFFTAMGHFGQICVGIFMFLGGYGLYKKYYTGKLSILNSIKNLYIIYWKIFIIFIPIAFIFFSNQSQYCESEIWHRYSVFRISEFLMNITGINTSYNGEWWFFTSYICMLAFGKAYISMTERIKDTCLDYIYCIIFTIILTRILPGITSTKIFSGLANDFLFKKFFLINKAASGFFGGIVVAKHNLIERILKKYYEFNCIIRTLISCIGCAALGYARTFSWGG